MASAAVKKNARMGHQAKPAVPKASSSRAGHLAPAEYPARSLMPPEDKQASPLQGQDEKQVESITGEPCPFCHENTLTLIETDMEVPYFGLCYLFSMDCSNCKYHKADVETEDENPPSRFTFEISKEEDMKVRVIKSSNATVKIPHIGSIEPGSASNGYITNIEGVLNRIKKQIEVLRDDAEEEEDRKKAKNLLKRLTRIMWGQEPCKLVIEDPTGNSAIISDRAVKEKLKGRNSV